MAHLLGIDIGTSACKVLLINEHGTIVRQATESYPISNPHPLWSEQNPLGWWHAVESCLRQIDFPAPDAIGVTGQMHGSVFLDANGDVIRPAILWNDQRTIEECADIDRIVGAETVRRITCNPPLTGFQLPKLLWLRKHEPEHYARVRQILLPKDYIRFKLSGTFATEVSDASGTGIFDVAHRRWSQEMIQALEVDPSIWPDCFESDEISARTHGVSSLNDGIPIAGGGGDQAAAAVGTGAVEPGIVSVSLGTSGVVFTSLAECQYDEAGSAHTFCHANRGWHAMGVMLSCGGALKWFRDTLRPGRSYDALAISASGEAIGADGLVFLPYLTGERTPHNDPLARGGFFGLTQSQTPFALDRAVFEGISFGLLDGFRLLQGLGAQSDSIRVTSGGSRSDFWVQMLSDVFGAPCQRLEIDEGPALGAAILAGVGVGVWPDLATACQQTVKVAQTIVPSGSDYSRAYARFRDAYRAIRDWNHGA